MTTQTWIIDQATGHLVVEGLEAEEASALAGDLLPLSRELNCARPLAVASLPASSPPSGVALRVARIWHGSVVDGPGRRSVLQVSGCPIRCLHCSVPETHALDGGVSLSIPAIVEALLDPVGAPRDGVTVSGGEPFAQPQGLAALLEELQSRGLHTAVYSGYTLEALLRRPEDGARRALELTDMLIDGPFVATLASGAGEWRGSHNQRLIGRAELQAALQRERKDRLRRCRPQ